MSSPPLPTVTTPVFVICVQTIVRNNPLLLTDPSGHCWGFASGLRGNSWGTAICDGIDSAANAIAEALTTAVNEIEEAANGINRAIAEWQYYHGPCGLSIADNCSINPATSPSEVTEQAMARIVASSWGGITPAQVQQVNAITDITARLLALNSLFGARPETGIEETYEFATSSRQAQLEQFAGSYFGDVGVDIVYTDSFGAGHDGRFILPGGEFQGTVYENGAIVISEYAIQQGWDHVGITIFHEWLERYRGELTHEQIFELERLWEEWYNQ